MINQKRLEVLKRLEELKYQSTVEKKIKLRIRKIHDSSIKTEYIQNPPTCFTRFTANYRENIKCLEEIRVSLKSANPKINMPIILPETEEEIKELALNVVPYFSQGYELYKTSLDMDINSSPIVEYYALLQIVKGVILLELNPIEDKFFNAHGLEHANNVETEHVYRAKPKTFGVFAALLIRCTDYLVKEDGSKTFAMDYYYNNYNPSLKDMINDQRISQIPEAFIFTWILSELARYQPKKWEQIWDGKKNNWIIQINRFREEKLPMVIRNLIISHID